MKDVLVIPTRPVPRLADLTAPELASLMASVQQVGKVVEKAYSADALTIACQVHSDLIFSASATHGTVISSLRTAKRLGNRCRMFISIFYLVKLEAINSRGGTMKSILP